MPLKAGAGVGLGVEAITVGSEEHALNRPRPTRAIPSRNDLVVVTGVIMLRMVVSRVIVVGVIVRTLAMVVPGMRIERRSRWRWWCRNRLLVSMRWVVPTGMNWVIVAERYTFEFAWGATDRFCLPKRNVMWGLAFENEIGRLVAR